jgi:hypothetical protein
VASAQTSAQTPLGWRLGCLRLLFVAVELGAGVADEPVEGCAVLALDALL